MSKAKKIIVSIFFTVVTVLYTLAVKTLDVKPIGPNNSKVGISTLNKWFMDKVGVHMDIYKITEVLGIMVLLIVGIYGVTGIVQLIKRKSLFKVDREIISLGILYIMMGLVYAFFEKFIINYRPVLIDTVLEASYPSSHTMLSLCICISSIMVSKKYLNNKMYNVSLFITTLLLTMVFVGRTISGVHYLTDIMGGVLISITLLSYFKILIKK